MFQTVVIWLNDLFYYPFVFVFVGKMARWRNVTLAKWRVDKMVRWRNGALAKWCIGEMAHWRNGTLAKWRIGKMVHWRNGASTKWLSTRHPPFPLFFTFKSLDGWLTSFKPGLNVDLFLDQFLPPPFIRHETLHL